MAARNSWQEVGGLPAAIGLGLAVASLLLAGCKTPSINLATSEPIKVDIAMRLDVYQHAPENGAPKSSAVPMSPPATSGKPAERIKNRQADIQVFKNSRLVGEGRDGLLAILTEPAGDYGDYVRRAVGSENADRMAQMKALAEKQKRPLPDVQKEQAALWANRSFKGEWIEVRDSGGNFQWQQKQG
ncbi:MAG: DUF1318 domain-containing protein [Terrimicrobiaceae bacterium]|nr:DUF1318 domain-containing protein [Terrimicrobiaceae bacterium]